MKASTCPLPVICPRCKSVHCLVYDAYGPYCLMCGYEPYLAVSTLPLTKIEVAGKGA